MTNDYRVELFTEIKIVLLLRRGEQNNFESFALPNGKAAPPFGGAGRNLGGV